MKKLKDKILIVDDDPGSLRYLDAFLTDKGYKIYTLYSGPLAQEIVKSVSPDLILLDIVMPEMDGFEVCRQLKANKHTRDIPVIFISTMQDVSDQVKAFQAGGVDYITKPLQPEEVLARLNTHLSLKNVRVQLQKQNKQLQHEIQIRKKTEKALQDAHDELEQRVQERTAELKQTNKKLKTEIKERLHLEKVILDISEREQQRIGHDLHDGLGQLLTGVAFMANTLNQQLRSKLMSEAENAKKIVESVNEGISQTSRLARGLYPVTLQKGGLVSALDELAASTQNLYGISCSFQHDNSPDLNNQETAIHLYRITQEAVNNAVKHSRAEHILIDLSCFADRMTLIVKDDGIGFDAAKIKKPGLGLQTMHYRAKVIKANINIIQPGDGGTIVICSM